MLWGDWLSEHFIWSGPFKNSCYTDWDGNCFIKTEVTLNWPEDYHAILSLCTSRLQTTLVTILHNNPPAVSQSLLQISIHLFVFPQIKENRLEKGKKGEYGVRREEASKFVVGVKGRHKCSQYLVRFHCGEGLRSNGGRACLVKNYPLFKGKVKWEKESETDRMKGEGEMCSMV